MYLEQGEPSEKCGELNFGLEFDYETQTLKLKIIQVRVYRSNWIYLFLFKRIFPGERSCSQRHKWIQ